MESDNTQLIDPVCGMTVAAGSTLRLDLHGQNYAFCSPGCLERFRADPQRYLKAAGHAEPEHPAQSVAPIPPIGTIYTCPMHPQVRQVGSGTCPICGMALEPLQPSRDEAPNPELTDMQRRFRVGAALALPVFALEMGAHLLGMGGHEAQHRPGMLTATAPRWIQFALSTPVVFWAGWPLLARGAASVRNRSLNMFSLIALGVLAAFGYSLAALFTPGLFPAGLRAHDNEVPVYFEAAAVITVLVLLGQVLELRARESTGQAIRSLLKLAPKTARRLRDDGTEEEVLLEQVQTGDRLRVRPGEAVPVDGPVLDGSSAVDESMVTGESLPVDKQPGAALIGGTINGTGALIMRAGRVGADTLLSRIVGMVSEAQRSRAPIQHLADRVAAWFVPAVILLALLTAVAWMILGPQPRLPFALVAAVSVLIIACPCALGLATPMSITVGIGKGANAGILVRDAEALERLEQVDTLLVDKTGTLTEGRPRVMAVKTLPQFDEAQLLALAASLERASEHPLAAAVCAAAAARGLTLRPASGFTSITGKGASGRVSGRSVAVGNAALLLQLGIPAEPLAPLAQSLRAVGATAIFVAVDGQPAAVIGVADPVKSGTPAALQSLRGEGIRLLMVTGDHRETAQAVAHRLGIEEVHAGMLPEHKHALVRRLRGEGRVVAMAGDGVNDAPALAAADVGIAMGTGTDVAINSAPITLVKGDLAGIARARALSRATMRNIRQNLWLAFAYNVLGIPIAAGALYPAFNMLLSPVVAAAAMSLSSVCVIGNALRLRFARL